MTTADDRLALACLRDLMRTYVADAERYINHTGLTPSGKPMPRPSHRAGGEFMAQEGRILKVLGLVRDYWAVESVEDVWVQEVWATYDAQGFEPDVAQQVIENWLKTTWNQSTPEFEIPAKWSPFLVAGLSDSGFIALAADGKALWQDKAITTFQELGWRSDEGVSQLEVARIATKTLENEKTRSAKEMIAALPDNVAEVLRAELSRIGPLNLIKEVGTYWRDGRWHATPKAEGGFVGLDLRTAQQIVDSLRTGKNV